MADFNKSIEIVLKNEGKYVKAEDDLNGGETYKGVSRKNFPNWIGWKIIDASKHQPTFPDNLDLDVVLQQDIKDFYRTEFWNKIQGDNIISQTKADSIFDFAVNAGVATSIKVVQRVVGLIGVSNDGIIGPNTINRINQFDEKLFVPLFIIEKIKLYIGVCNKRPENKKFFFGWVNRSINS